MTLQYINFDTTLISDLTDELRTYLLQKYDEDLSADDIPKKLNSNNITWSNLKKTWIPVLFKAIQLSSGVKSNDLLSLNDFMVCTTLPDQIDKIRKQCNKDKSPFYVFVAAGLVFQGLISRDTLKSTPKSWVAYFSSIDHIKPGISEYVDRIGTLSNGSEFNYHTLLAICTGTSVIYENQFGNWQIMQQQQHLNYLIDYYIEQYRFTFDVDADDLPFYRYTNTNGIVTKYTYDTLIKTLQTWLYESDNNTDVSKINGDYNSIKEKLYEHNPFNSDINELTNAALTFNGCVPNIDDLNPAIYTFCDRYNLKSDVVHNKNSRKEFYDKLFGEYYKSMFSRANVALIRSIHMDTTAKNPNSEPMPRVNQAFVYSKDPLKGQLSFLQLSSDEPNKQYVYTNNTWHNNIKLQSIDFTSLNSEAELSTTGHTQTLILGKDFEIVGCNPKKSKTSKYYWDIDFKWTIDSDKEFILSTDLTTDILRSEAYLSQDQSTLLVALTTTNDTTKSKVYFIDFHKLQNDINNSSDKLFKLSDYKLDEGTFIHYIANDSFYNGKSIQGYGVDNQSHIYVSSGFAPENNKLKPPFLITMKKSIKVKDDLSNYIRVDLGPSSFTKIEFEKLKFDDFKQYIVDNDLQNVYLDNKADILARDGYLYEFESLQVIKLKDNTDGHYACYLNIAYHNKSTHKTEYNRVFRLDWYDKSNSKVKDK